MTEVNLRNICSPIYFTTASKHVWRTPLVQKSTQTPVNNETDGFFDHVINLHFDGVAWEGYLFV